MGHVTPIKTLQKRPRFTTSLAQLGNPWDVPDEMFSDLEEFTCAMSGNLRFKKVGLIRLFKIKEKCEDKLTDALRNIDMGTFPPCKRCLI